VIIIETGMEEEWSVEVQEAEVEVEVVAEVGAGAGVDHLLVVVDIEATEVDTEAVEEEDIEAVQGEDLRLLEVIMTGIEAADGLFHLPVGPFIILHASS
jgi:hypothetical protein